MCLICPSVPMNNDEQLHEPSTELHMPDVQRSPVVPSESGKASTKKAPGSIPPRILSTTTPRPPVNLTRDTETGSHKTDCSSGPETEFSMFDSPLYTEKYAPELYEVVVERVRVRLTESRRSRRVCELTFGTRVRCCFRDSSDRKSSHIRIDLPVTGWCTLYGKYDQPYFKRVPISSLSLLKDRYVMELELGRGSFGCVYAGWDVVSQRGVAIKIDKPKNKKNEKSSRRASSFVREIEILRRVKRCPNVPRLLAYGQEVFESSQKAFMVMELQGLSLSVVKKNYISRFSLKSVLMVGIMAVNILRSVHKYGIVHRDIKPANFVVDLKSGGRGIHLLDFGLSVMYITRNERNKKVHVEYKEGCKRCGTARYSSLNCHLKKRQSRRDDLEALGYVLLLFIRDLPWKQHKGETPDRKWKRIYDEKRKHPYQQLCEDLPPAFCKYFDYVRDLKYSERPDYEYLTGLFGAAMDAEGYENDLIFDWVEVWNHSAEMRAPRSRPAVSTSHASSTAAVAPSKLKVAGRKPQSNLPMPAKPDSDPDVRNYSRPNRSKGKPDPKWSPAQERPIIE